MMKIDSITNRPLLGETPKVGARPAGKSSAAAADEVKLSEASTQLAVGGEPAIDTARVQEIRQAIAEGRFQINASAIADRLLASARDLVHKQSAV